MKSSRSPTHSTVDNSLCWICQVLSQRFLPYNIKTLGHNRLGISLELYYGNPPPRVVFPGSLRSSSFICVQSSPSTHQYVPPTTATTGAYMQTDGGRRTREKKARLAPPLRSCREDQTQPNGPLTTEIIFGKVETKLTLRQPIFPRQARMKQGDFKSKTHQISSH